MPTALFLVLLWSRAALSLSLSIRADCKLLSPVSPWPAGGKFGPTIDGDVGAVEAVHADFGDRKFVAAGGFTFEISSGSSNVACVCPLRRGLVPSEFVRLSPRPQLSQHAPPSLFRGPGHCAQVPQLQELPCSRGVRRPLQTALTNRRATFSKLVRGPATQSCRHIARADVGEFAAAVAADRFIFFRLDKFPAKCASVRLVFGVRR